MGKVNVQARIIARKVTFSFMYSHIFLFRTKESEENYTNLEKTQKTQSLLFDQTDFFGLKDKKIPAIEADESINSFKDKLERAKDIISQKKISDPNKKSTGLYEEDFFVYKIEDITKEYLEEAAEYILNQFFSYNKTPVIDMAYFLEVADKLFDYKQEVFEKINSFTSTFSIERMDISDQCIFVIAYTEWKTLGTPKEILINEMVELAKRYGDDGSPKLVNGILHKIIS